jgi:hypothetical protein
VETGVHTIAMTQGQIDSENATKSRGWPRKTGLLPLAKMTISTRAEQWDIFDITTIDGLASYADPITRMRDEH